MQTTMCIDPLKQPISQQAPFSIDALFHDVSLIRLNNPLIHNITNLVVMPTTANILLALGASPLMAHAKEELAEIIQLAQALVINIGTLDKSWLASIKIAQKAALKRHIPIVFDPVGAGASHYRSKASLDILKRGVHVIRGNASEILALLDTSVTSKGVDARHPSGQAFATATSLAQQYQCIVVVSGKIDFIVSATKTVTLAYGTPLLTKVVGMGCSLTAMLACFLTVNPDLFTASVHAMAYMGLIAEYAEKRATGPGSFYIQLLDSLYSAQKKDWQDERFPAVSA